MLELKRGFFKLPVALCVNKKPHWESFSWEKIGKNRFTLSPSV